MITVVESCQLCQTFLIRHTQVFSQCLYIRFHLSGKFLLADTADSRILVEHTDVIEVIQFAEDAELRELGDTRDEGKLQVWIEHLDGTIEVLHDEAQRFQIFLFMHYIQQRGIIFINDNHYLLTCLLVCFFHQVFQTEVSVHLMRLISPDSLLLFKHICQISFQLLHSHVLGAAQVEMQHRVLHPILLIISNGQSLKKFFPTLEIGLEGRCKERLSESSWTTQKNILHFFLSKIHDVLGLINIEIITLSDIRECLYSYRIEIYHFCHIPTCFTFCAAKLRIFF